jgi:hypothetical protein
VECSRNRKNGSGGSGSVKISKSQAFSNENRTHHRSTIPLDYGEIVELGHDRSREYTGDCVEE